MRTTHTLEAITEASPQDLRDGFLPRLRRLLTKIEGLRPAEDTADAWLDFIARLEAERRGEWRFVPDARFDIYGARR